jgi:hypothetical protein
MDKESKLVGANGEKLILSPDEAKERIEQKAKRRFSGANKYNVSRDEAVSIAVQIGQEVYDQLRAEHALTMAQLQDDMGKHFADIRRTVVINLLDLQSRSVSYRIRFDFEYDVRRIKAWLAERWELVRAWLELRGVREEPEAPRGGLYADPGQYEDFFGDEPEHVGAPTELPSDPGIARVLTLASDETPD